MDLLTQAYKIDRSIVVVGDLNLNIDIEIHPIKEGTNENGLFWAGETVVSALSKYFFDKSLVIVNSKDFRLFSAFSSHCIIIKSEHDKWLFARLVDVLQGKSGEDNFGIHPTAIVHPAAKIGSKVYIGPYTVIEEAIIGDDCHIDGHVYIYNKVSLGKSCKIEANSVLGASGSGYVRNPHGKWEEFPQLGELVIGDNVHIGVNTYVNRGTLGKTEIGDNVKIGLSCCIGHNVVIGENAMVLANTVIAGGVIVGADVYISIGVTIRNKVKIGKGCFIGMGSVVTKSFDDHTELFGVPARAR